MSGAYGYAPGGALALCGPRVAALVDLPPDAGLVPGLYELISNPDGNLDEVLELLVTPGLRAVRNFALAERTEEGVRFLVRGRYRAEAGSHTIEARGLWTDRIVQADTFSLVDPEDSPGSVQLPLPGGVALAGRLSSPAVQPSAGVQPRPGVQPSAGVKSSAAVQVGIGVPSSLGASEASAPSGGSGVSPAGSASGLVAAEDAPAGEPSTASAPSAGPAASPEPSTLAGSAGSSPSAESAQSAADPGPGTPQSSPWSPTNGPAEAADAEPGGTGHTLPTPFTSPITDLPSPPPVSPPPAVPAPVEQPTFIESLPWSTEDVSPSAQVTQVVPQPAAAPSDAPSDRTVSRDSLPRQGVQTVVAARCPSGHASPAYAGTCRVCGQPLPAQQPVEIPRPPLGVLRLSNGDTVMLDRGCILGRNPRLPTPHAGEQPNLVKLVDPDKDISGQHLEVRLEYWHVAVKDLGSTNGTQVVLPGENPVTLRPNDPMMIEPGTKVILAGVFSFTFEVTP